MVDSGRVQVEVLGAGGAIPCGQLERNLQTAFRACMSEASASAPLHWAEGLVVWLPITPVPLHPFVN